MICNGIDDAEAFARLRLIRSQNIGPITYHMLMSRFGSALKAIAALPDLAARGRGKKINIADANMIAAEIDKSHAMGAKLIFWGCPDYPQLLMQMESAPACLIVRGNIALLQKPMVAIVGARNASAAACRFARTLSHDLKQNGFTVVSGLARGIDTAVHMGAGGGGTAAIIAGGINIAYPPENTELQERLAIDDIVISEEIYGTKPIARHFPNRNRIIAGLSLGTLVVEAAPRSGSLITARLAGELGREVMAIPGSPLDPRSRGCNQLIRDGATLVQSADDISELLMSFIGDGSSRHINGISKIGGVAEMTESWDDESERLSEINNSADNYDNDPDDKQRQNIENLIGMTFVAVDELVRQSGYPSSLVQMVLLELELSGRLERAAGQRIRMVE